MRALTWNIQSGGGSRISEVLKLIQDHSPDLVLLTEFRNKNGLRIRERLQTIGLKYQSKSYAEDSTNAVLIAAREPFEEQVFPELGEDAHRCVLTRFEQLNLFGLYFPQQQAKERLFKFLVEGITPQFAQSPCLLLGDFNTGKQDLDRTATGDKFYCSEYIDRLESLGWVDVWRSRNPDARVYTWYSNAGNGFRIDHAFVSHPLLPKVCQVYYSHAEREAKVSDHSALIVELE